MKTSLARLCLVVGVLGSSLVFAQAPGTVPAGSTGLCKDGSYTSDAMKKGACGGHKGVKDWYGPSAAASAPGAAMTPSAPAASSAKAPAMPTRTAATPPTAPAAGGGPGQVWVNPDSKVYHCAGGKYYGKTKRGEYMTETAAKAAGNHPDHGKACS